MKQKEEMNKKEIKIKIKFKTNIGCGYISTHIYV